MTIGLAVATALLVGAVGPGRAASLPPGFQESVVISGLNQPTTVKFAADGHVFVAEKSGLIKVFDGLNDTTPTIFADLRTNVHNFWDRGLLGLELHPDFPNTPYVYVLYTLDAEPGGTPPRWGTPGATSDGCPNPPGAATNGCVVGGRLSRLQAAGDVMTGPEEVLVEGWCQQFPSHSMGSLAFGADGALYVSGGEGASFTFADWGQAGFPLVNPCDDPPAGIGGAQTPPDAAGGALRAQSLRRADGPVLLNGAILRVDPSTGEAMPDNPLFGGVRSDDDRLVAYGLRNPFRITARPGADEVWVGDVGWGNFEEINRIPDTNDAVIENFGWPCYDGAFKPNAYDSADLAMCESLYATPGSTSPAYFQWNHDDQVVPGESCGSGSSSITGLAFYQGGTYPSSFNGALFFADYSRDCIWEMPQGTNGDPDPSARTTFASAAANPVNLQIGTGGDLYYVDFDGGAIRRIQFFSLNQPPVAVIQADPMNGLAPLTVQFDAAGSSDPDAGDTISYAWDLDGDGEYDDSTQVAPQFTYDTPAGYQVGLRVTDSGNATGTASVLITAGNTAPIPEITLPTTGTTWSVGDQINFEGTATDAEDGELAASALTWTIIIHHCPSNCHTHPLQSFDGIAAGFFSAPDHDYPSHLEIRLTAVDAGGLTGTTSLLIHPNTVALTLESDPPGLDLVLGDERAAAPFVRTVIVGSNNSISAPSPQAAAGSGYQFASWSDGGPESHDIIAPAVPTVYTATFAVIPTVCGDFVLDGGEQCDDGNTISGDCCAANCQIETNTPCDLTDLGFIIARVPKPTGGGNKNLEVIRNNDKPPVGNSDGQRQYDSYDGPNTASEDWIGYQYGTQHTFTKVVFQEGKHPSDGGWFDALTVQVRQGAQWGVVSGLTITPMYPAINNGTSFETYTLRFDAILGDALRIYGAPGGSNDFISVGELEVFGGVGGNQPPVADASAPATAASGQLVTLDGGKSIDPDHRPGPLTYHWTQTAGPTVALSNPNATKPTFTAPSGTQVMTLAFRLVVDDGTLSSSDTVTTIVNPTTDADLTRLGNIIVRVPKSNVDVIRDGDKPPVGNTQSTRQYDSNDGNNTASEDWVGYEYASPQTFGRVVFQEGRHFGNGGWFDTLTVQVRQNEAWVAAPTVTISPLYPAINDGVTFQTYVLDIDPMVGDAIRIYGHPGGSADFISVGELEIFGTCDDRDLCTDDSFDPLTGCQHTTVADGSACYDGDLCNGAETCQTGLCLPGPALVCNDGNPCSTDTCDPLAGCQATAVADGTACSDGTVCNGAELCEVGVCNAGTALNCDDGDACTTDACDGSAGCQQTPIPGCGQFYCLDPGTPALLATDPALHLRARLEEGTGVRVDSSVKGNHLTAFNNSVGNPDHREGAFSVELAEASGQYLERSSASLAAGFPGNTGGANTSLTVAGWVLMKSEGYHPLVLKTEGSQRSWSIWLWKFGNDTLLDPNVFNAAGQPGGGGQDFRGTTVFQVGQWYHFAYTYDGTTGLSHAYINGQLDAGPFDEQMTSYFRGTAALRIGRRPGFGQGQEYADVLLDEIVVLDRALSAGEVAILSGHGVLPTGIYCDDGDVCNGLETCGPIGCEAGTPLLCDDGDACTDDSCDPLAGCQYAAAADGTDCSDGDACNGAETCQASLCAPGTPPVCVDGNPCTTDSCAPLAGCAYPAVADGTECSDGDACNGSETCQVGSCSPGSPPACGDGNPCTTDSCVSPGGCEHAAVADGSDCSDGNVCNGGELCQGGFCAPGSALVCDDANPCTTDSCAPLAGCQQTAVANGLPCSDGDVCNGSELCQAGACLPGTPLGCDDGNPCTTDTCGPITGCTHDPIVGCVLVCGNDLLDQDEQCDDGNMVSGDCCTSTCQISPSAPCDLTHLGFIIARVRFPTGSGSTNLEVIRNGDMPPVGTSDPKRQYDTYDGANTSSEDWIGYQYMAPQTFTKVVFQEGKHFNDGGWFENLAVQVKQNGLWVTVSGLTSTPVYPAVNNGLSYETYTLNFTPTVGDAIRIGGTPGGTNDYISVGELKVFGGVGGNQPPLADAGSDQAISAAQTLMTLNGQKSIDFDARPAPIAYLWEQTGGPAVTLSNPAAMQPTFTPPVVAAITVLVFQLTVDDGALSGSDSVVVTINPHVGAALTQQGTTFARFPKPKLTLIRDGDKPPVGNADSGRQYDSSHGSSAANDDWVGYTYPTSQTFARVVFQEGRHFVDGGWFETLTVQVRQGGQWVVPSGVTITPVYPGIDDGLSYQTYTLDFQPTAGDGVRIYGVPGGSKDFVSVGELEIFSAQ